MGVLAYPEFSPRTFQLDDEPLEPVTVGASMAPPS
jgi:hypothetical protein